MVLSQWPLRRLRWHELQRQLLLLPGGELLPSSSHALGLSVPHLPAAAREHVGRSLRLLLLRHAPPHAGGQALHRRKPLRRHAALPGVGRPPRELCLARPSLGIPPGPRSRGERRSRPRAAALGQPDGGARWLAGQGGERPRLGDAPQPPLRPGGAPVRRVELQRLPGQDLLDLPGRGGVRVLGSVAPVPPHPLRALLRADVAAADALPALPHGLHARAARQSLRGRAGR
mmetsp:Transcript_75893/g.164239  ORF Transcript_75893/g.164239 Transcript_75893/m.164239 type:complete len:230 (-) Transcript_75893:224-913(-)